MDVERRLGDVGDSLAADEAAIRALTSVVACNKGITNMLSVSYLHRMVNLTSLNLHMNHISKIENLTNLRHLTSLDLSANDIEAIQGINHLIQLKTLNLSSNRITSTGGLTGLLSLQRLAIAFNMLTSVEGLGELVALSYLDLAGNKIVKPDQLRALANLANLRQLRLAVPQPAGPLPAQSIEDNPLVLTDGYISAVHKLLPAVASIDDAVLVFDVLAEERSRLGFLHGQPGVQAPHGKVDEYLRGLNAFPFSPAKPRMKKVTRGTMTELPIAADQAAAPIPEPAEVSNLRNMLAAAKSENLRLAAAVDAAHEATQRETMMRESAAAAQAAEHAAVVARLQREIAKPQQQLVLLEAELNKLRADSERRIQEFTLQCASLDRENGTLKKKLLSAAEEIKALLRELRNSESKASLALKTFEQSMRGENDARVAKERAEAERRVREETTHRLREMERQHNTAVAELQAAADSRHSLACEALEASNDQLKRERARLQSDLTQIADRRAREQLSSTIALEECERRSVAQLRDRELQVLHVECSLEAKVVVLHRSLQLAQRMLIRPLTADAILMTDHRLPRVAGVQTDEQPCIQCHKYTEEERPRLFQCVATLERQLRDLLDEASGTAAALHAAQADNVDLQTQLQQGQDERENMLRTIRNLKESLKVNEESMQELEEEASAKIESKRDEVRQLGAENDRLRSEREALVAEISRLKSAPSHSCPEDLAQIDNLRRAVDALRNQLVAVDAAYRAVSAEKTALAKKCESMDAAWRLREGEFQHALQEQRASWEKKIQGIVSQVLS